MTDAIVKAQQALDKRTGRGKAATIHDLLESKKGEIAKALPRHMDADRLAKVAWGSISRTPGLMKCSPVSLMRSVMQAAELGLEPCNSTGQAYLIPFKGESTLIIGYKGFIELAARGGKARFRPARVVYDCDEFVWEDGLHQRVEHRPGQRTADSLPTHVYVAVDFVGELPPMVEVMTIDEVEAIRHKSRSPNSGPWRDHWEEMAKKTVVRRMAKYVPLSPELQRAAAEDERRDYRDGAIEADFTVEEEGDSDASDQVSE